MIGYTTRKLLVASVVAGGFLATPSESYAIFHWFSRCCAPRATFLPVAPAAPCAPACAPTCAPACAPAPQVCNYVPVTAFRTQVCNVPVTAYRPCTSCDPCTGCPTTTYRPVTTMVRQVRRVPYTTYRISCSSPCSTGGCATGGCSTGTCGSTVAYQSPAALAAPSSCSSCAPSTTFTTPAPAAPVITTPPPTSNLQPTAPPQAAPQTFQNGPASQQPSLSPVPNQGSTSRAPQTFETPSSTTSNTLQRPIQDLNTSNSQAPSYPNPAPRLIEPNSRATQLPGRTVNASYITAASPSAAMAPAIPVRLPPAYQTVNSEGWRSSSR